MGNQGRSSKHGMGLCILLAIAMVVLFFVASIAVSFVFAVLLAGDAPQQSLIGVNYGRVADNLPPPSKAVELMKSLRISMVKIYDANAEVLKALSGSGMRVTIMVTNQEVAQMASSANFTDSWVQRNVLAWMPGVSIETVVVGNEILSDRSLREEVWPKLVPAMENLHASLDRSKLSSKIAVTTSLAIDCLSSSFPPSSGNFRADIAEAIIRPLLRFLVRTRSFFFINVYPYFAFIDDSSGISLGYALFDSSNSSAVLDGGITYANLLDAQLDALVMAMTRLGYGSTRIAISETGWPSAGSSAATTANAAAYNGRLVRRLVAGGAARGTPRRPGHAIPTFIFSLFNEDQKPGAATERNWGLLYPNGTRVYQVDLTGKSSSTTTEYALPPAPPPAASAAHSAKSSSSSSVAPSAPPSVAPSSLSQGPSSPLSSPSSLYRQPRAVDPRNVSSQQRQARPQWCVAGSDSSQMQVAIDYACEQGDCSAIQPGEACYLPASMRSHASYAFNSYWQRMKKSGADCNFQGSAKLTSVDPSYGSCVYPVI